MIGAIGGDHANYAREKLSKLSRGRENDLPANAYEEYVKAKSPERWYEELAFYTRKL